MKKILVFLVALVGLMSCTKDAEQTSKSLYHNTTTIGNVTYDVNIANGEESYSWANINRTEEVTYKYTFNYERKADLQKDFASIVEGLNNVDGSILPVFERTLRFSNNEEHVAIIAKEIEGGNVFVRFVVGTKIFKLPYNFVIEANNVLNPKE